MTTICLLLSKWLEGSDSRVSLLFIYIFLALLALETPVVSSFLALRELSFTFLFQVAFMAAFWLRIPYLFLETSSPADQQAGTPLLSYFSLNFLVLFLSIKQLQAGSGRIKQHQSLIILFEIIHAVLDLQGGKVDWHLLLLYLLQLLLGLRGLYLSWGICILAAIAFAGLGAGDPCVVTLAIPLQAVRFFAVAAFLGEGTVPEAALLDSTLGHSDFFLELERVLATEAGTVFAALPARGEALAVHLEAEGLLAGAPDLLLLGRVGSGGHPRDAFCERVVLGCGLAVLEGEVEVIEREVVRDRVDGVDHLQALVDIGELLY